jgi:hypothetical protein
MTSIRLVLPQRGWSQLEPPAALGSAELQPSCGGLAGPGSELVEPGWRRLGYSSAMAPDFPNLILSHPVSSLVVEVFVYAPKSAALKCTLINLGER